jgi:pilus assembly protein CpaE
MNVQEKTTVIVVDDTEESREMILRMLQFDSSLEVIGGARSGLEAIDLAQRVKPDVIVMDINMPDMDGIAATEAIRKKVPYIQVIILSVQNDSNYMRQAMLAGARDFLSKPPQIEELINAVKRGGEFAREEKAKYAVSYIPTGSTSPLSPGMVISARPTGKIIAVYSPKGGVGCTMLTTNLATSLKTPQNRVAVMDANFLFGDVAVFMNEHAKNTFRELLERADELDPDIIENVMVVHKTSGIHLITSPKEPDLEDAGKGPAVSKILTYMQQMYDYILVDTTPYLTEVVQTCLDIADLIILITTQDIPAIKNANQFLSVADASGISRDRILFIMNRYDKRIAISPERVGTTLKQPVVVTIPFEERVISNSINRGVPFITENKTLLSTKAILELVELIKTRLTAENEEPVSLL